jgi:hypothetical protein
MLIIPKKTFNRKIRSIKIKDALSGILKVNDKRYQEFKKSKEYKVYKEHYDGKPITGSIALKMFGLMDRRIGDLDIIDDSITHFDFTHADDYNLVQNTTYRGSVRHKCGMFDERYVDVFEDHGKDKIIYKDIVLDQPLEILKFKYDMIENNFKHNEDIREVFEILDV